MVEDGEGEEVGAESREEVEEGVAVEDPIDCAGATGVGLTSLGVGAGLVAVGDEVLRGV